MTNKRLPLDVIEVTEPCHESWDHMTGDDRVRMCAGCYKLVYNLSAMDRDEAERLVCERAGNLCVRFARTETGRVQTLEYRAPARPRRGWRFWTVVSTCAASIVAGANGYLLARGKPAPPAVILGKPAVPMVMGMIAPIPAAANPSPTPDMASPGEG